MRHLVVAFKLCHQCAALDRQCNGTSQTWKACTLLYLFRKKRASFLIGSFILITLSLFINVHVFKPYSQRVFSDSTLSHVKYFKKKWDKF